MLISLWFIRQSHISSLTNTATAPRLYLLLNYIHSFLPLPTHPCLSPLFLSLPGYWANILPAFSCQFTHGAIEKVQRSGTRRWTGRKNVWEWVTQRAQPVKVSGKEVQMNRHRPHKEVLNQPAGQSQVTNPGVQLERREWSNMCISEEDKYQISANSGSQKVADKIHSSMLVYGDGKTAWHWIKKSQINQVCYSWVHTLARQQDIDDETAASSKWALKQKPANEWRVTDHIPLIGRATRTTRHEMNARLGCYESGCHSQVHTLGKQQDRGDEIVAYVS